MPRPRFPRFPHFLVPFLACLSMVLAACSNEAIVTVTPVPSPAPIPPPTLAIPSATPLPVPTVAGAMTVGTAPIVATAGAFPAASTTGAVSTAPPAGSASTTTAGTTPIGTVAVATAAMSRATAPPANATAPGTRIAGPATATKSSLQAPQASPQPTPPPSAKPGATEAHTLPGGTINLPPGWDIRVYATGLGAARFMSVRPADGAMFVADAGGRLLVLTDNGGGPDVKVFATGLNQPSSVAFWQDWVYVGETNEVVRFRASGTALTPQGAREVVVPNLPTGGGHWTRTVAFGPDGKLYVAIGSSCNVCIEQDPRRAAISVYDPDGKNGRVFATGLRNAVGITWQPGVNQMWATVNGRDNIGDDIPPDDLRTINDGTFYGWPYCYGGKTPNPEYKDQAAAKCKDTPPNARSLPAHVAPLGLAFGDGLSAPQPYKDSLYIAYHGSWNRSTKVGYKLVRVPFIDGKAGQPEDFATGWLPGTVTNPGQVWGRPVGVTVGRDGALYVTDDSSGVMYRIAATGS